MVPEIHTKVQQNWSVMRGKQDQAFFVMKLKDLMNNLTKCLLYIQGCWDTDVLIDYLFTLRLETILVRRRTNTQKHKGALFEQLESAWA